MDTKQPPVHGNRGNADVAWARFQHYQKQSERTSFNAGPIKSMADITAALEAASAVPDEQQTRDVQALIEALR